MRKMIVAAAFSAVLGVSASTAADPNTLFGTKTAMRDHNGSWYLAFGAGAFVQETLPVAMRGNVGDGTPFFSKDVTITGGGGGFTVGRRLGGLFSGLGRRPRIEVGINVLSGSGSASETRTGVAATNRTIVTGGFTTLFGCGAPGCTYDTRVEADYLDVTGTVTLKTDFRVGGRIIFTPSLGVLAGQMLQQWEINNIITLPGIPGTAPNHINESLRTYYYGGQFGLDVSWMAGAKWTIHGGAGLAVFQMGTNLRANDCWMASLSLPPGSSCTGTGFMGTNSRSDYDHHFGLRVGVTAGVTFHGGWYRVTVAGSAGWSSAQPGVNNPNQPGSPGTTSPIAPASIRYDSAWRYGGAFILTILLN